MKAVIAVSLALFSASTLAHQQAKPADPAGIPISKTVSASSCWIRSIPAPAPSGGFFVLKNQGTSQVRLTGAQSPSYAMVMLHQTTHSDGMSRMSEVHDVAVPAAGQVEFKPGDYHVMLEKAEAGVKVGSVIQLNLLLDDGTKAVADCEVKPPTTMGGGHAHGAHGKGH